VGFFGFLVRRSERVEGFRVESGLFEGFDEALTAGGSARIAFSAALCVLALTASLESVRMLGFEAEVFLLVVESASFFRGKCRKQAILGVSHSALSFAVGGGEPVRGIPVPCAGVIVFSIPQ